MRSYVNWAVLGLLIEKPSYGYEVSQRFERRFGEVLRAGTSHIYAALNSLEKALMIEPIAGEQERVGERQPKVHYRVTGTGARAYRDWLAQRMRDDEQRTALFSRLLSAGALAPSAMLQVIDRYERECLADADRAPQAESLAERLVAEERRIALQGQLTWIAYARREIRAADSAQSRPPRP